ncbi:DUF5689 domain-containing protein [Winogradskyella sp. 3972H.M.0a.05]|uniref:DUF5689 domain-containing protein n=1 Tax=Winogradskyella sp. 3972H.M.0a.05 TaxID=2950277 RepID=UPI0033998CB8
MKSNKFLTYLSAMMLTLFIVSCVNDDDFSTPNVGVTPVDTSSFGNLTTFNAVVGRYEQAVADGDQIGLFTTEEAALYIEGYVVSSDEGGNFFEEIIIQNSTDASDPAGDTRQGLRVEINVRSLSDTYDFGRKVYVRLNGLAIGLSNGVYTLGRAEGNEVGQIQEFEYLDFVIRDSEVATITPKVSNVTDLTEADENTLIQLPSMQINRNQLDLTFAGEGSDEFDGFRTLESCAGGGSITLQTSTFADFKSLPVPQGGGSITGILSRDFFDDLDVFVINSIGDIDMIGDRCDPDFLECTTPGNGSNTLWEEDFESFGTFASEGWDNINTTGGNLDWVEGSFSGNAYAQISGFSSNESPFNVWLVTPAINLDASTGENLSFDVQTNFNNGDILSVFITDNYTGDPTTTEWKILDVNIPAGSATGFGNFEPVGPVNISCLDGDVHVGFFYEGSDPGPTTRYHVDNVEVRAD